MKALLFVTGFAIGGCMTFFWFKPLEKKINILSKKFEDLLQDHTKLSAYVKKNIS